MEIQVAIYDFFEMLSEGKAGKQQGQTTGRVPKKMTIQGIESSESS